MNTVLLTGATGLVGRICLQHLLNDPYFGEVKVIARRPLYTDHPKLSEFISDFDKLSTLAPNFAATTTICCLGSTIKDAGSRDQFMKIDHDYVLEIANLAYAQGSRHFIVISAVGANKRSLFFYSRVKGLMEEDIKSIPFETVSILQPSLIDGERKEVRVMEQLTLKLSKPIVSILPSSLKKYGPLPAEQIAKAICHTAKSPRGGVNYLNVEDIKSCARRYSV